MRYSEPIAFRSTHGARFKALSALFFKLQGTHPHPAGKEAEKLERLAGAIAMHLRQETNLVESVSWQAPWKEKPKSWPKYWVTCG